MNERNMENAEEHSLAEQLELQLFLLLQAGVRYIPGRLPSKGAAGPGLVVGQPIAGDTGFNATSGLVKPPPRVSDWVRTRLEVQAPARILSPPAEEPSLPDPIPLPVRQFPKNEPRPIITVPASISGGLFVLQDSTPGPAEDLDKATRLDHLASLRAEVGKCVRCKSLSESRVQTVFGVGPLDAELCIVGEAPGASEDQLGEPFVGEAGQLLNKMLSACGFSRSEVFICNILRCRPPGNRAPLPEEAVACFPFLVRTLELVKPRFLCLMGATATRYLLDQSTGVGVLRKRDIAWRGIPVQATYHPAYLLRYPEKKRDAWEDLQRMLGRMGRKPPQPS